MTEFIDKDEILASANKVHKALMEEVFRLITRGEVYRFRQEPKSFTHIYNTMEPHWHFFFDNILNFLTDGDDLFEDKQKALDVVLEEFEKNQKLKRLMAQFQVWEADYFQQMDAFDKTYDDTVRKIHLTSSFFNTSSDRQNRINEARALRDKNIKNNFIVLTKHDYVQFLGVVWDAFEKDINAALLGQTQSRRGFRLKNN